MSGRKRVPLRNLRKDKKKSQRKVISDVNEPLSGKVLNLFPKEADNFEENLRIEQQNLAALSSTLPQINSTSELIKLGRYLDACKLFEKELKELKSVFFFHFLE